MSAMLVALVAGALLISLAPILARLADVGPVASGMYRVLLASPVLWLMVASEVRRPQSGPVGRRDLLLMAAAGLFLALDLCFFHIAIGLTSVANATLFNNTAPIFVALMLWLGGRPPGRGFVAALAVAMAGMALLMGGRLTYAEGQIVGDAMAIGTGALYGGYIMVMRHVRQSASTALSMAVSSTAAVPPLVAFALLRGDTMLPASAQGWAVLIALALVCHVAGQGLIALSLSVLPAAFSAMVLLIQPVSAGLIAWALFGETQTALQVAGIALVLAGLWLARRTLPP